jgi:hypothetical protein
VTTVVPVVGDVCTVVVTSVTVGLVVLTDTVVGPWVDYRDSDISCHTTSYFSGINNNFNRDNSTKQYYFTCRNNNTVGLVVLTDTVVGPWVDVLTSGEVVVDCTEVEGCVTTVVPVVGDVCTVVVTSVTVGLVVLTDTVVGPWVDVQQLLQKSAHLPKDQQQYQSVPQVRL